MTPLMYYPRPCPWCLAGKESPPKVTMEMLGHDDGSPSDWSSSDLYLRLTITLEERNFCPIGEVIILSFGGLLFFL